MPCALGSNVPMDGYDCITHEGQFQVSQIYESQDFGWPGDSTGRRRPYGPFLLELNHKFMGIHGTDEPDSIGLDLTHGCIRLRNEDITKLVRKYVDIGTIIEITE